MPDTLNQRILTSADDLFEEAIVLRRKLHQIPETAWQEYKTSKELSAFLKRHKITQRKIANTGILAEIRAGEGKCVAIRSDIDALPIQEETDYPFKSTHPGRMHACGHDIHMAIVCLSAAIIKRLSDCFHGQVKLFYQPAEEKPPGGAVELIKAGVMHNPDVEMVFGLHVNSDIRTGRIGIRDGVLMAGVLDFDVEITGTGGHGAFPHKTNDPLVCAAALIINLKTIISRSLDPFEPAVITTGKIEGGTARNVIPPSCKLLCTARALSMRTLRKLRRKLQSLITATARSFGCRASITWRDGYPPLINVPIANSFIRNATHELFGSSSLVNIDNPLMGGEDFARYLEHAPGTMFHLGVRNKKLGATYGWHHPKFKADESAIKPGAAVLTRATIDFLND